jgi:antitoxin CptB
MRAVHPPTPTDGDARRRRLVFRANHRGTHETDLILGGFANRHVAGMSEAELSVFEAILDLPDPDLFDWVTGRCPVPAEHESPLLARLIAEAGADSAGGR